jgi:membrane-bound metal-dependent hydrolase YbcI (DUF457 family)
LSWAAHELESYVIQRHVKAKVSYTAILIGCLAPDMLTKLPVYGFHLGPINFGAERDPWEYHRGFPGAGVTHTLFFAVLISLAILWIFKSREWSLGLLLGTAAHVLTDMFDSVGTMVLFPFTTQQFTTGMWAYAAQQGRYGDAAAYYSSLGGVWDVFWLVIALLNYKALSRSFFFGRVVTSDPFWPWLRRRFRLSDRAMLALYRSYFFYGACRIFAWFIWARVVERAPLDLSWGGPFWVVKAPGQDEGWAAALQNTAIGLVGFAAFGYLVYRYAYRPLWRRVPEYEAAEPLSTG